MILKPLEESQARTLEDLLSRLYRAENEQRIKLKQTILEIITELILQGYNAKRYWEEYRVYLKQFEYSKVS